jgi:hypothetical protein
VTLGSDKGGIDERLRAFEKNGSPLTVLIAGMMTRFAATMVLKL